MTAPEEISRFIQSQLKAIDGEIAALQKTLKTLDQNGDTPRRGRDGAAPTDAPAPAPAPSYPDRRRRRARAKRTTEVVPAGKLEQLLSESDGLTTAALASQANGRPDQVRTLLRELEAAGRIRRTGERRGVRWHAITDEDRIAARAAELAARSRSAGTVSR
jgi:hypothetical protein